MANDGRGDAGEADGKDLGGDSEGDGLRGAQGGRDGESSPGTPDAGDHAPRFLADEMLGKLARWLRLLGYDVAYAKDVSDEELRQRAVLEHRVLLTRDVECARRTPTPPGALLVRSRAMDEQLREVAGAFHLTASATRRLSRCSVCNARLDAVLFAEVRDRLPEGVAGRKDASTRTYFACPGCGRAYWEGTHVEAIGERLDRMLDP